LQRKEPTLALALPYLQPASHVARYCVHSQTRQAWMRLRSESVPSQDLL